MLDEAVVGRQVSAGQGGHGAGKSGGYQEAADRPVEPDLGDAVSEDLIIQTPDLLGLSDAMWLVLGIEGLDLRDELAVEAAADRYVIKVSTAEQAGPDGQGPLEQIHHLGESAAC